MGCWQITGDSIFNLLRIGEVDTDQNDWPLDPPPRIKSVEVGFSLLSFDLR